jgi:translation initiation factor IF-3
LSFSLKRENPGFFGRAAKKFESPEKFRILRPNKPRSCRRLTGSERNLTKLIQIQQYRVNQRIRAREVRVILSSTGQQLGIMKIQDALRAAQQAGLDLVEVAPTAAPPVCRIVDFGKFKYELAKHEKDKKHATSKLKEIKFRVNISPHDYETKLRHAEEFLDKSNKVRTQLQFRGRENAHKELGMDLMRKISEDLVTMANVEQPPKLLGRAITMTLAPLPAGKRKRKFAKVSELPPDIDDEETDSDEDEEEENL